jgi:hypothetical protein
MEEEGEIGHEREVILSHGLWEQLYAGDKSVLGRDWPRSGSLASGFGLSQHHGGPPRRSFVIAHQALGLLRLVKR